MITEEMQANKFDQWAIVEVMGHKKYAGHVTEQTIAGAALIRVDVPEVTFTDYRGEHTVAQYSKLIGVGSIYMITPTTENIARRAAITLAQWERDPIPVTLPAERQLPASAGASRDEDEDAFVEMTGGMEEDDVDDGDYIAAQVAERDDIAPSPMDG